MPETTNMHHLQLVAINRTVEAIAKGINRILLVMATGTGKTCLFRWRMWMWTTLAALLGWLATTGWLMWRMQPRRQAASEERTDSIEPRLFRELAKACEANEAANARAALTRWGQRYFGEAAPPTLQTLAGRFASEDIRQGLDELERSLFSPSGSEWSGRALVDALRQWRKNDVRRRDARPPPLAPLYRSGAGTSGAAHGGV